MCFSSSIRLVQSEGITTMGADKRKVSLLGMLSRMGMDEDADLLRDGAQFAVQVVSGPEAIDSIGAGRYERIPAESANRDWYGERSWGRQWEVWT
jgi:hypothetical protein